MSALTRRQMLQRLVGCVATAGTVVLARTVLADNKEPTTTQPAVGPDERADRVAERLPGTHAETEIAAFVNRAFRNVGGGGGGFRNGGFANGAFRNGGFANGAFRNGAFRNW